MRLSTFEPGASDLWFILAERRDKRAMTRFQSLYHNSVSPTLREKFGYVSVMQIPRVVKITLNMGVGGAVGDKKILEGAVNDMRLISGQQPVVTKARRSVAGFKIRAGWSIGCKGTLRRERM